MNEHDRKVQAAIDLFGYGIPADVVDEIAQNAKFYDGELVVNKRAIRLLADHAPIGAEEAHRLANEFMRDVESETSKRRRRGLST